MDLNSFSNLLIQGLPIWILCIGGLLCLLVDALLSKKGILLVYTLGLCSIASSFYTALLQWSQINSSQTMILNDLLIIDLHSVFFTLLILAIGFITLLNALSYIRIHQILTAEFCSLVLFTMVGMIFLYSSDHLLVNFIGLETMSLSLYILVASHKKSIKSSEAAMKYFIVGGVASAIFLYGIAIFYGGFQTMRLSLLSVNLAAENLMFLRDIAIALVLSGVFFKLAVVPFQFWAPDVYEGAPSPVTGFMATAVKVSAFGFLLRFVMGLNILDLPKMQTTLLIFVVGTLIVGNVGALVQKNVKRMLAYSSISHAGFALLAILVGFEAGQYEAQNAHAVLFYLLAYLLMTLGAFAFLSLLTKEHGEASDFADIRGLGKKHPVLGFGFTLFMLSMIGLPGTIGFIAKYNVLSLAVSHQHFQLAIFAIIMSVISVYYYLKPSVLMFFPDTTPEKTLVRDIPITATIAISLCAFLVVYLGILPDNVLNLVREAALPLQ